MRQFLTHVVKHILCVRMRQAIDRLCLGAKLGEALGGDVLGCPFR